MTPNGLLTKKTSDRARQLLLLDTHIALWVWADIGRIGPNTRETFDRAWGQASNIAISAIAYWEVALLMNRGKIELQLEGDLTSWRTQLLGAGLIELGVDGEVAIVAGELVWDHRDPADRFIVATAIVHDCTLVTVDSRILNWDGDLKTLDATK